MKDSDVGQALLNTSADLGTKEHFLLLWIHLSDIGVKPSPRRWSSTASYKASINVAEVIIMSSC